MIDMLGEDMLKNDLQFVAAWSLRHSCKSFSIYLFIHHSLVVRLLLFLFPYLTFAFAVSLITGL